MRVGGDAVAFAAALACVLCVCSGVAARAGDVRIAVLISHKAEPYTETVAGFKRHLGSQGLKPRYDTYVLDGNVAKAARAVQAVRKEKPDLLLTLGSLATESALREITETPIVAGVVMRGDGLRKARNATGVYLEFPVETQFKYLKRFLPTAGTVGVLYNPEQNQGRVDAAARAAESMGLRLEPRPVRTPQDVPGALKSLEKSADVLWGLYDTVALTPETAKQVLLFSFRSRIPVVGLSASWVKAGALYALEWNYADLGAQCGEMADKLLRGATVGTLAQAPPRRTVYVLNLNTAKRMRIEIPDALLRGAGQVFKGAD